MLKIGNYRHLAALDKNLQGMGIRLLRFIEWGPSHPYWPSDRHWTWTGPVIRGEPAVRVNKFNHTKLAHYLANWSGVASPGDNYFIRTCDDPRCINPLHYEVCINPPHPTLQVENPRHQAAITKHIYKSSDGHWIWTGPKREGVPHVRVNNQYHGEIARFISRASHPLTRTCSVSLCVNPEHYDEENSSAEVD